MRHRSNLADQDTTLSEKSGTANYLYPLYQDEKLLRREYRRRNRTDDLKSVHPADVPEEEKNGWTVQRPGKRSTRLKREKSHFKRFEDRIWCLLFAMGYRTLNGENFNIAFSRGNGSVGKKQIDVYAEDDETVFVIECKSRKVRGRRSLQKDIQETISLQSNLRNSINQRFNKKAKPKIIWIYATINILWSAPDIERAEAGGISIVTENELQYFEAFVRHIGPAGKYQILGEFLKGQKISGLTDTKIAAVRGKIAGEIFYSFVTTPRQLLKIAFINHQALNHPDGRPAYQRMISRARVKEINTFIEKGGFFPTNILINFSSKPRFDQISNKENTDPNTKFGWLTLPATYRSAWVIDGQHRLYGFSHLDDSYLDQSLFVLAFEKMTVQKEADLFITINHKQKSVPKSLLVSLLADIRMGDANPTTAITALGSAIVRKLDRDKDSPLAGRFAIHGIPPEPTQNLTIPEVVNGLRRSSLIGKPTGKTITPGPFSGVTDADTVNRAVTILSSYFEEVRAANSVRWEGGRDAFTSVNPGIRAHLVVISEVVKYLSHKKGIDFELMAADNFSETIIEFCTPIFNYFEKASDDDVRSKFSRKFGEGGVKEYGYHLMQILSNSYDDFGPEEFQRWVEQSTSEKIDEVNQFLMKLAERLTNYVIDTLKEVHGTHRLSSDEQAFWEVGVESERIRRNAYEAQLKDKKRRKPKEAYLNIVDLSEIVKQKNNWDHFEHVFNNPRVNERTGHKYYLGWIQQFNELRNIAAHKNQLKTYTDEDLEFVEWLRAEVSPKVPDARQGP